MKTLRIRRENPAAWYSNNACQPAITPNALSQLIKLPPWCPANPLAYTSITSHLLSLLQRKKTQGHGGQGKATHQGRQRSTKEAYYSRVSFLSTLSCALDCNLMVYPSLFSALTCFLKKSLELKKFLSTSSPIPPLKEKTPCRNKGQTTNSAVAFNI
jgi:hypothetical protein